MIYDRLRWLDVCIITAMQHHSFKLPDGRLLSYSFYGPDAGQPVLYFHGTPSSRLEPLLLYHYGDDLDNMLIENNIRLIAVDRPGMGKSTFNKKGNFISFAQDAARLAEHLGIRKCSVMCWSGGGPYALAVAHQYPELITGVFIICGFTKKFDNNLLQQMGMNRWYFYLARFAPALLRMAMNFLSKKKIDRTIPRWLTGLPEVDYKYINTIKGLEILQQYSLKEACFNGAKGPVHEARSYYNDFNFAINEIKQAVHYFWGTMDMAVIRLHPEHLEKQLPNTVMHYREREGHISLYVHCFKEVLQEVGRRNRP